MREARPAIRGAWGALAVAAGLAAGACGSSTGRRDQFYGTDVGANYRPPEAGVLPRDAGADGAGGEVAGGALSDAAPHDGATEAAEAGDAMDGGDASGGSS